MKAKATRRSVKRVHKSKPAWKSARIQLAGGVMSFFKKKNSFWQTRVNRFWIAFGKMAKAAK